MAVTTKQAQVSEDIVRLINCATKEIIRTWLDSGGEEFPLTPTEGLVERYDSIVFGDDSR